MKDPGFYIGYLPKMPAGVAAWVRRSVLAVMAVSAAAAVLLNAGHAPFAAATFEYQQYKPYAGLLVDWPYPMLITPAARYLLVAPGKHGLMAPEFDGQTVQLKGALIRRAEGSMLEVLPESLQAAPRRVPLPTKPMVDLGEVALAGEIVDSKCFFGVMNPGRGKVHRDCAARCISGGVPPALLARDASGVARVLLLTGRDGRRLGAEILPLVAEPVHVRGRLRRQGSTWILQAEPGDFRRE